MKAKKNSGQVKKKKKKNNNSHLHVTIIALLITISGNVVPYDGMPNRVVDTALTPVTVIIDLLAVVGILFAVVCGTFNFVFRNKRFAITAVINYNYSNYVVD